MLFVRASVEDVEMGVYTDARMVRFCFRSATVTVGAMRSGTISTLPDSIVETIW